MEVGVDGGTGIVWTPVSELQGDGGWRYMWALPADGVYQLYVRARDGAGNLEEPGAGVEVKVNQTPPGAVSGLSIYDRPDDSGGHINLLWALSADEAPRRGKPE